MEKPLTLPRSEVSRSMLEVPTAPQNRPYACACRQQWWPCLPIAVGKGAGRRLVLRGLAEVGSHRSSVQDLHPLAHPRDGNCH
eukprot:475882-Prymnesium_polylepis.1